MRHTLLLMLLLAAAPAAFALEVGSAAPPLEAEASLAGRAFHFSLEAARRAGPVVVYFYPSAFTRGCDLQAHEFATHEAEFRAAGARVIGVSLDDLGRLNRFSADPQTCAGKVPVAADPRGDAARAWGVGVRGVEAGRVDRRGDPLAHGLAERTTFVVSTMGRVEAVIGGLAPQENVAAALAAVQSLAGR